MKALVIGGTGPTGHFLVNGLRARGYAVTILHSGNHEVKEIPDDVEHIHTNAFDGEKVRAAVRDTLETLSERDQQLLRLYYYDGLDYQAIAESLDISINSVGAALSRARGRLAKALDQHEELTESDWRSV